MSKTPHQRIILDLDSSESPVHGEQEELYPVRTKWTLSPHELRDGLVLDAGACLPEWRRSRNGGKQGFLAL